MLQTIREVFDESIAAAEAAREHLADRVARAVELIVASYRAGGGVFVFGNGGSACDALHIAGELVGRFRRERRAMRAHALPADPAVMTGVANDYGFEAVFARQLEGLARPGDVAIGISTSGNSPNVLAGLEAARRIGMRTIAMTGRCGGRCASVADVLLDVPSDQTARVQEVHAIIYHAICQLVEDAAADSGGAGEGQ